MGRGQDKDNDSIFYGQDLADFYFVEDAEWRDAIKSRLENLVKAMHKNEKNWEDSFPRTIAFGKLVQVHEPLAAGDCAITISIETTDDDWLLHSSMIVSNRDLGQVNETTLYKGKDLEIALESANSKSQDIASSQEDPRQVAFDWNLEQALSSIDRATDEELGSAKE